MFPFESVVGKQKHHLKKKIKAGHLTISERVPFWKVKGEKSLNVYTCLYLIHTRMRSFPKIVNTTDFSTEPITRFIMLISGIPGTDRKLS